MDSGKSKGPVCGIENCRSRIYEEGEDGYLYCENGHRKGDLVVGQDEDDFTTAVRVRTRRRRDEEETEKASQYFRGQQALDLYLKCYQLILRHQLWFLIKDQGLPAELEGVVFDLWALRIVQLEERVSRSQPYDSQSQGFSTSEFETDSTSEREITRAITQKQKLKTTPSLMDGLALCYLGIIALRLPVTPGDLHRWVTDGKLLYRRAFKILPFVMRDKLPGRYRAILNPNSTPTFERFYAALIDLEVCFCKENGLIWPALNRPLLLVRYLKELALPLELYDTTTNLAQILEYSFVYSEGLKGKLEVRRLPEAQLVSCLVVGIKLLYPFDGQRRYPKTMLEPATTTMDWDQWQKHITSSRVQWTDDPLKYSTEELLNMAEKDVLSMSGRQLDQYLDFYHENFIDTERISRGEDGEFRTALYNMFPVDDPRPLQPLNQEERHSMNQVQLDTVKAVHATIGSTRPVPGNEGASVTLRPAQNYRYYRREGDLPETARRFYEEAAKLAGLSMHMLITAIFLTEKKIDKWRIRQMRENKVEISDTS